MLAIPGLVLALCAAPPPIPQAAPAPARYVVRDVRLGIGEDAPARTLVLEGGRIVQVLEVGAGEPGGARVVEADGYVAVPAFLDAYSTTGCKTPQPDPDQDVPVPLDAGPRVDMRLAGRKGIQPAFRAAEALELEAKSAESWRASGFGTMLSSPAGELLAGTSVLASIRDAAARDLVLDADVFAHATFGASGPGYPSTLMGYTAQLRQVFLDAARHADLRARHDAGKPGPRPPFDADLEALLPVLAGHQRVAVQADDARDIELWLDLAQQHGFEILVLGGREAWRVRERLAQLEVPVVLTLDWGEEVDDPSPEEKDEGEGAAEDEPESSEEASAEDEEQPQDAPADAAAEEEAEEAAPEAVVAYEEPLAVREERRRLWEQTRDCALRLEEAGVQFAFGTADGQPAELLKNVRALVEVGLDPEAALAGLGPRAARMLEAERNLGALEVGRDATLALWTKSPLEKGAELAWLFVDGFAHEFDLDTAKEDTSPPDEGVDASGTWTLSIKSRRGTRAGTLELEMAKDGVTTGTLTTEGRDGNSTSLPVEGRVAGSTLTLKGVMDRDGTEIETTITAELDGDSMKGDSVSKMSFGEFESSLTGTRDPRANEELR